MDVSQKYEQLRRETIEVSEVCVRIIYCKVDNKCQNENTPLSATVWIPGVKRNVNYSF